MIRIQLCTLMILAPLAATPSAVAQFTEEAAARGFIQEIPTWGAQMIDLDGDGDVDVLSGHHFFIVNLHTNDSAGNFTTGGLPQIITSDGEDRHGLLCADLDGDGLPDVVSSHGGGGGCGCPAGGNELWASLGEGLFSPVAGAGGMLDANGRGRAFSAADVDGDGDLDLYHAKAPLIASPNSLYRNDGGMTFTDIAIAAGLDETAGTVGGLFADFDDDGDPDLFVGGEEFTRSTILWRNDGGTFTDVTNAVFGGALPVISGADWGDMDNDGDLDLAICEGHEAIYDAWGTAGMDYWFFANHRLSDDGLDVFRFDTVSGNPFALLEWRGTFAATRIFLGPLGVHPANPITQLTDDYVGAPTFTPGVDEGMYVWRLSPGGPWEIHVSAPPGTFGNYSANIFTQFGVTSEADSSLEQIAVPSKGPRVFRNDGGIFTEVTGPLGLTASGNPRGLSWVDFDNDGDLDLHVMDKGTAETPGGTDVIWRNDGSTYAMQSGPTWVDGASNRLTDGGVWSDLTGDGLPDLFLQEGAGPNFFSSETPARLYVNQGPGGNWLALSLGMTLAGGTPVGAAVTMHAGSLVVHRRVEANAWRGFQEPLALHFGLGTETTVDSLVIAWPGGSTETLGPIAANQRVVHAEGDGVVSVPPRFGTPGIHVGAVTPQPASGAQRILLTLPRASQVRVDVYDLRGRHVRTLADGTKPAGEVLLNWDGRDGEGRRVPTGVYFLRGVTTQGSFLRKVLRIR